MKTASVDTLYFETGRYNPVTLRVNPGEEFEVRTQINRGPWLENHPDKEALLQKLNDNQAARASMFSSGWSFPGYLAGGIPSGNPSSGCIFIEEATPDHALHIHIGKIDLDPVGYTNFNGNTGAAPGWFGPSKLGSHHKVVEIRDGLIHWDKDFMIPAKPMIGMIGVAPNRETYTNSWAGYWGGNLDAQEVTTGATLVLGVNAPGGLLHVGDMHAIQGDGEICGAGGVEAGGRVRIWVDLHPRPKSLFWPRLIDATHIAVLAAARPMEDAFRYALEGLVLWMEEDFGFNRGEAFLLLGQVMEARCTAIVNPTFTYIAKIPKKYLRYDPA